MTQSGASQAISSLDVDPAGMPTITSIDEAPPVEPFPFEETGELRSTLVAARRRGRHWVAEILSRDDMLSAEAFAKMLGTSRVTVNAKRQTGHLLGLHGAKRGFRFPAWQIGRDGKPFAELSILHERLGSDPWAVYRFLVQRHGKLDGLTGREGLERGESRKVLEAAESVDRDLI